VFKKKTIQSIMKLAKIQATHKSLKNSWATVGR